MRHAISQPFFFFILPPLQYKSNVRLLKATWDEDQGLKKSNQAFLSANFKGNPSIRDICEDSAGRRL